MPPRWSPWSDQEKRRIRRLVHGLGLPEMIDPTQEQFNVMAAVSYLSVHTPKRNLMWLARHTSRTPRAVAWPSRINGLE